MVMLAWLLMVMLAWLLMVILLILPVF